jgi:hypothetical protein
MQKHDMPHTSLSADLLAMDAAWDTIFHQVSPELNFILVLME